MHMSSVTISQKNLTLNPLECKLHLYSFTIYLNRTGNNLRLESAGDNDRSSKCFCSNVVLCISFTRQMIKTRVIRLRGVESRNVCDQIAFCSFLSFLVEGQMNAGYIRTCDACVITTWRLRLWAPLFACNEWVGTCNIPKTFLEFTILRV